VERAGAQARNPVGIEPRCPDTPAQSGFRVCATSSLRVGPNSRRRRFAFEFGLSATMRRPRQERARYERACVEVRLCREEELVLRHFSILRRRALRNALMASAMAAAATGASLSAASAHVRHAPTKTGMSHAAVRHISDTTDWRRDGARRREIRDKLSAPSPARKIEKGSGADSGIASIYSGRQTASGEAMDPGKMTAAQSQPAVRHRGDRHQPQQRPLGGRADQ
jgi:hypothetical protein